MATRKRNEYLDLEESDDDERGYDSEEESRARMIPASKRQKTEHDSEAEEDHEDGEEEKMASFSKDGMGESRQRGAEGGKERAKEGEEEKEKEKGRDARRHRKSGRKKVTRKRYIYIYIPSMNLPLVSLPVCFSSLSGNRKRE